MEDIIEAIFEPIADWLFNGSGCLGKVIVAAAIVVLLFIFL